MTFIQTTPLLNGLGLIHGGAESRPKSANNQQGQQSLRSTSALANLIYFARHPVENVGEVVENWYDGSTKEERARRQVLADRKQLLYLKLRTATTHAAWEAAAKDLDDIEGNNEWKLVFDSPDYDAHLVDARLKQLEEARISCDVGRMLFLIRTSLSRGLGDMGNLRLYKHTHIGTKKLIEQYINSALATLNQLLDISAKAKCDGMETKYILEQVISSRQAFGRSALLLSGGATFGMSHIGVLKALHEAKLLPRIISGASAGSIVSAVVCTRTEEEVPELIASFCDGDLAVFEEEGNEDSLFSKTKRFLTQGALYDISHLKRVMRGLLGEMTFQEAYNRTRKILNICVSSASLYELPRLLNYITAPNVLIWSAVAASCSVPCVYTAAPLLAKDPKTGEAVPWNPSPQRWIDGSVDNDIPMTRLAEMFNVNHFIVSQVNPHVVPFLTRDEDAIAEEATRSSSTISPGPTWFHGLSHLAKGEALHRMHTLAEIGFFPNILTKTVSVLSQKYSGDITILPEISLADFPRMLSNPTPEFMRQSMLSGERATWPKIGIIQNHCAIELALDDAVQKLRARVAFSPSEVELRKNKQVQPTPNTGRGIRGKRTMVKRPLSQNSTASAPISATGSSTLHTHNQAPSGRLTPSLRHKKSRSINTVITAPTPTSASEAEHPTGLGLVGTRTLPDVISSGAETSNLTSSSSATSFSSPTDEPSSPVDSDTGFHHERFTTSQPATPYNYHPTTFSTASTSTSGAPRTSIPSLSMTPSKSSNHLVPTPAKPESTYKRLFHSGGRAAQGQPSSSLLGKSRDVSSTTKEKTTRSSSRPEASTPKAMKRNWGLEIDIPAATKNLVTRGKKKGNGET